MRPLAVCLAAAALAATAAVPAAAPTAEILPAEEKAALRAAYKRPDTIPFPAENPYTPEKATLGKMLYYDPRLSGGQNLGCASCHNPSFVRVGGPAAGRHWQPEHAAAAQRLSTSRSRPAAATRSGESRAPSRRFARSRSRNAGSTSRRRS